MSCYLLLKLSKNLKNICLEQQIMVYTDHNNLTYKNFNTEHVMQWQLLIEEFRAIIKYIKGPKNVIATALSRLDLTSLP